MPGDVLIDEDFEDRMDNWWVEGGQGLCRGRPADGEGRSSRGLRRAVRGDGLVRRRSGQYADRV